MRVGFLRWLVPLVRRNLKGMLPLEHARSLSPSLHPPCEHTARRQVICNLRGGLSPGTKWASTLLLDFPAFANVRNKCVLFKSICSWCYIIATQADQDSSVKKSFVMYVICKYFSHVIACLFSQVLSHRNIFNFYEVQFFNCLFVDCAFGAKIYKNSLLNPRSWRVSSKSFIS